MLRKVCCFLVQLRQTTDHTVHSGNNSSRAQQRSTENGRKAGRNWRITLAPTAIKGLNRVFFLFFIIFALTRSRAAKSLLAEFSFLFRASANIDRINKAARKVLPQTKREANASSATLPPPLPLLTGLSPVAAPICPKTGYCGKQLADSTPNE